MGLTNITWRDIFYSHLKKITQMSAPHMIGNSCAYPVIVADTEYHTCNRFVNNYFHVWARNFIQERRNFTPHIIIPQMLSKKTDRERKGRWLKIERTPEVGRA